MTISKVIIDFSRNNFPDLELISKSDRIQNLMTGNVHFETPDPPLIALKTVTTNFTVRCNNAIDGSKEDTSLKKVARLELQNILRQLGEYVQHTSFGIEDRILSSGFDVAKKPEPVGPLEQATGLLVHYGNNSGEVTLECNAIPKARMYYFAYTDQPITPETTWITVLSTKHQVKLSGLTSGLYYEFRVTGVNADPSRNWSEPLRKLMV